MRILDYRFLLSISFSSRQEHLLRDIHIINDRISVWKIFYPEAMELFAKRRIRDDILSSHGIEMIPTSAKTVEDVVDAAVKPRSIEEQKIAGLYDAIKESDVIAGSPSLTADRFLDLHRELMCRFDSNGGKYRKTDRPHIGYGTASTITKPVSTRESRYALHSLCNAYNAAMNESDIDKVMLAVCATLDFFTISPFENGNGRMYRLVLGMLLNRAGLAIHRYASLERAILDGLDDHLNALKLSSDGWSGDFFGYTNIMEDILKKLKSCCDFINLSLPPPGRGKLSKAQRLDYIIDAASGPFTKAYVQEHAPDIAAITIQNHLQQRMAEGTITKIGRTKGARYVRAV